MDVRLQPAVSFRSVEYAMNGRLLLRDLTLDMFPGEIVVLLGRSGAGKTSTLMMVNRMVEPTQGEVRVQGIPTTQWDPIALRRRVGYAIQEVALFPHLTVARNIAVVPELESWPGSRVQERVSELLKLVGLGPEMGARYPRQLSGGQQQRVGVARALAADPPVLLMDEPFGGLDPLTRAELQRELIRLQRRLQKTILFVTHDLHEALVLGSRIVLMEAGEAVLVATPAEFQRSPHPLAVAYREAFGAGDSGRSQGSRVRCPDGGRE